MEYTEAKYKKDKKNLKKSEPTFLSLGLDMTPDYAKGALDMLEMISKEEAWEESEQYYKSKFFNLG